jgi:small ligand-binding sensory domain FIST
MNRYLLAHATHPQWRMAATLVLAQLRAQIASRASTGAGLAPNLALLYITDHYANEAEAILAHLSAELPEVTDWSGTVGVGIAATGVEYFDEPAMAVMLCDIPADQYRVFSGVTPLAQGFTAHTALVHADGHAPELGELIEEMAARTSSGYLFGGLAASRKASVQFAQSGDGYLRGQGRSSGVFHGGLSGVAFGPEVALLSRVTQGCAPLTPVGGDHVVTEAERHVVYELDGEPALDVLLRELGVSLDQPQQALQAVRATLVGLVAPQAQGQSWGVQADERTDEQAGVPLARTGRVIDRGGLFGPDVRVRHIVGLDPQRGGVALAERVSVGMQLAFCQRNVQAARADLIRICTEIRAELEPEDLPLYSAAMSTPGAASAAVPGTATEAAAPTWAARSATPAREIAGALYVSCSGRGGPHFGAPSAELQLVRHALGDVPLIGFFAGGEIAHRQLHGYTGVLTVFLAPEGGTA